MSFSVLMDTNVGKTNTKTHEDTEKRLVSIKFNLLIHWFKCY